MRLSVCRRLFRKYFPTTTLFSPANVQSEAEKVAKERRKMVLTLVKIQKQKTKKQFAKMVALVSDLKRQFALRHVARTLNVNFGWLTALLSFQKSTRSSDIQDDITDLLDCNHIAMDLPHKRYAGKKYLRGTIRETFKQYLRQQEANEEKAVSYSTFYRAIRNRHKKVKLMKQIPSIDCLCKTCVNMTLKTDALLAIGVKGISRRNTENVIQTICPCSQEDQDITQFSIQCIRRDCQFCGSFLARTRIIEQNPGIDMDSAVLFHEWKPIKIENTKKKPLHRVLCQTTCRKLISLFCENLDTMALHLFDFKFQAMQFDMAKKQLRENTVLMVLDFAQNVSLKSQFEAQSGMWHRPQITLHPIVCYYRCPQGCGSLVTDEIMLVSDDRKHDFHAVKAFTEKALEHLEDSAVVVAKVIQFSDNCTSQYKSAKTFFHASRFPIPFVRNYFGAGHGKGPSDGFTGRVKQLVLPRLQTYCTNVNNAATFVSYCSRRFGIRATEVQACQHKRQSFFRVNDIDREESISPETVPGTLKVHCVRNKGIPGQVELRCNSCVCPVCVYNEPGTCENHEHVEKFVTAEVSRHHKRAGEPISSNNFWGDYVSNNSKIWEKKKRDPVKKKKPKQPRVLSVAKSKQCLAKKRSSSSIAKEKFGGLVKKKRSAKIRRRPLKKKPTTGTQPQEILPTNLKKKPTGTKQQEILQTNFADHVFPSRKPTTESDAEVVHFIQRSHLPLRKQQCRRVKKIATESAVTDTDDNRPLADFVLESLESSDSDVPLDLSPLRQQQRGRCWQSILKKLKAASTKGFEGMTHTIRNLDLAPLQHTGFVNFQTLLDEVDTRANIFMPPDYRDLHRNHTAVTIGSDGNCFPRALSRFLIGTDNDSLHEELRTRIVGELVLNMHLYLDNAYLARGMKDTHSMTVAHDYAILENTTNINSEDSTFCERVYKTAVGEMHSSYMGIWAFHAAANIVGRPIRGVFPDCPNELVRQHYNRMFFPSDMNQCDKEPMVIMWTQCATDDVVLETSAWHFVCLVE